MTTSHVRSRLRQHAEPSRVAIVQRFFKTGPGEYAEGDVFIGVTVPHLRRLCRDAAIDQIEELLRSPVHEERLLALLLLPEDAQNDAAVCDREVHGASKAPFPEPRELNAVSSAR